MSRVPCNFSPSVGCFFDSAMLSAAADRFSHRRWLEGVPVKPERNCWLVDEATHADVHDDAEGHEGEEDG
jgi:hypothetical protein